MSLSPRTGASVFFDVLVDLGVEFLFGHTGGAVIPLHVELNRRMKRNEPVPQFILFLDEFYYQANNSREVITFLEHLYDGIELHLKDKDIQARVMAAHAR